jgi:MoaA/NifB/PqqE/SkfB family radical SAM enzyme
MWQRGTKTNEMSIHQLRRFVRMLGGYPIDHVELFGGDALLRKDAVIAVTREAHACGIPRVELVSNGNLLDERTVDELFDAGINVFTISLDGVGALHDYMRGTEGSFERIRKIVAYMVRKKNGQLWPKVALNCTVSALNVDGFEKVLPFADEIGADTVSFEYVGEFPTESINRSRVNGCRPDPFYVMQGSSILLTRPQAMLLKQKMKRLKEDARGRRVYMNSYNIDFLKIENLVNGVLPNKRCCVCRYMIITDPYGNLIPCPFFNNYHMGNVGRQHLRRIWNNGLHSAFVDKLNVERVELCRHCILGVERNPTLLQSIRKAYLKYAHKGYDELPEYLPQPPKERVSV